MKRGTTRGAPREPVERPALARAGEGLDRAIVNEYALPLLGAFATSVGMVVIIAMVWFDRLLFGPSHIPWGATIVAGISMVYAMWWLVRARRALPRFHLGRVGEVAVGEALDRLRERRYRVFHDVGSEGQGNIDHVLIGASGVYVIETKTRMLPPKERGKRAEVLYDGERVKVGDGPWDDAPIVQVRACCRRVCRWLESEGMGSWGVPVRGVVMYPGGWWIEGSRGKDDWVLKPEALSTWVAQEERKREPIKSDRLEMLLARFEQYARRLAEQERSRR